MSKKVLIIEDDPLWHDLWGIKLKNRVVIIKATSIEEAEERFAANPDIAAIAVDACVPGKKPTTLPLVRKIRGTFGGPMIAISGEEGYRKNLMDAGCDYQCVKKDLHKVLVEVLGLAL